MLTWEFPPRIVGGIASHVSDLSRALTKRGIDVTVVTCDFPGAADYEDIDGVHVHRIDSYRFPTPDFISWVSMMNLNMLNHVAETMGRQNARFDLLHAHDWLVASAAIGLKNLFRIPLVATVHATEYGRRNGLHTDYHRRIHQTEMWLCREAWRIICCSGYMASHVSQVFDTPRDKIDTIPNGVVVDKFTGSYDPETFRPRFANAEEKLVLYVGRLVYEKGADVFIKAGVKVLQNLDAKFVIVGDGYKKNDLMKLAWDSGIGHKVFFTGFIDVDTLRQLYHTADVFVVPSLYEPFGIVALEAMAARTPVVASNVGGLSEIVDHETTGIHVYPGNSDSLAWGILRVLENPRLSTKLREQAYRKVNALYNWDRIAGQTEATYSQTYDEYAQGAWKPTC
jgi:glycosyltransferase involved in cell wall biosynthesis